MFLKLDDTRKTPGGSWLDWRAAWREMGRSESEIAAEDHARAARADAQIFEFGKGTGTEQARRRARRREHWRTWGKSDENLIKMRARLAPVVGYITAAIRRECASPSWISPEKNVRWLYQRATLARGRGKSGLLAATSAATRWRDFSRAIEWAKHVITGWRSRGEISPVDFAFAMAFLDGNSPCEQSYSQTANPRQFSKQNHFTDTGARVSSYELKSSNLKTLNEQAEIQLTPEHPEKGAVAPTVNERVQKWTGSTFPRRLWWLVWKWLPAFRRLHAGKLVAWSEPHFIAWFKSCLAVGKRCVDLFDLYEDKILKWHGLASDWRVESEPLHPRGLFSELYRAAAALPNFSQQPINHTKKWILNKT